MTGNEYQECAAKTALYPSFFGIEYTTLGLVGEAGEIANKVKKRIRDGESIALDDILSELGDVLWYVAMLAREFDLSLDEVMAANIAKLRSRQERGALHGSGDAR